MELKFEKQTLNKRLKGMLKVDFKRVFTTPFVYIMIGISFIIPILVLVMTTSMAGVTTIDPVTGNETVIETFTNVWQTIGTISGEGGISIDLTTMCNINMLYFLIPVFVCIFIGDDFRSGYAKNLFTVRSKKSDYVISKTMVGFVVGTMMLISYFIGAILGGAISGLSFDLGSASVIGIIFCMISKIFLALVFIGINVVMSVFAKQRLWLSIICSLASSMLLFTMVPMITPLDSSLINVILCLIGGGLFSLGLGVVSNKILNKTSLV